MRGDASPCEDLAEKLVPARPGTASPRPDRHLRVSIKPRAVQSKGESLIEKWQANALLEPDPHGGLRLTASGAWFTGNLIAEIDTHAR